jgi:hypothetical protein
VNGHEAQPAQTARLLRNAGGRDTRSIDSGAGPGYNAIGPLATEKATRRWLLPDTFDTALAALCRTEFNKCHD